MPPCSARLASPPSTPLSRPTEVHMNSSLAAAATPSISDELVPEDHVIVLFGATGDLARRKLLPGFFRLAQAGLLPARYRIVATSRTDLDDDGFRTFARDAITEFAGAPAD